MTRTAISLALACCLLADAQAQGTADAVPMDRCQVIARIGNQVVLSCELLWQVNLLMEKHLDRIPADEVESVRQRLLQQHLTGMLDMRLLYTEFRNKLPDASLPEIHKNLAEPFEQERVPQLMKQLGVDERSEVDDRLRGLGGTIEDVRQDYFMTMIARSWLREGLKVDETVTHEQLLEYYREHGADYDSPARVRWEELMVRFGAFENRNQAWAAIAEMGNAAFRQAQRTTEASTPAFAEIAKKKSQGFTARDGGVHDWTTKNALAARKVDEALFSLKEGEMSPILQSQRGFHIVRVLEREAAGRKPFSDVQSGIESKIVGKRFNEALEQKLAELRRTTQIWTVFEGTTTAE
ncbi:MAG: peptidylprolyl isomerase, partial [Planctomycetota bacterium]